MKPLISIIIPVYNIEDLIEECVISCMKQSYDNIEIILVDDGALDDSGNKCDLLKEKDCRIKVFHTKNQGLGEARNYGLNHSQGEYIAFVDGDDVIEERYIETLYELLASTKADIAGCRFYRNEGEELIYPSPNESYDFTVNSIDYLKMFYNDFGVFAPAWGKLSKRSLWDNIRFETKTIAEDAPIIRPLILKCSKISWTQEPLYFYRNRGNSISQTANSRKIEDSLGWLEEDIRYYKENNMTTLKYITYKAFCFSVLDSWERIPKELKKVYRQKYIERAFEMLVHEGNTILARLKYICYIYKLR